MADKKSPSVRKYGAGKITTQYADTGQIQVIAEDGKGRWKLCDNERHAERYLDFCATLPDPKPRKRKGEMSQKTRNAVERRLWISEGGWRGGVTAYNR